eukprot:3236899-Prymnesium_polylepis.1
MSSSRHQVIRGRAEARLRVAATLPCRTALRAWGQSSRTEFGAPLRSSIQSGSAVGLIVRLATHS